MNPQAIWFLAALVAGKLFFDAQKKEDGEKGEEGNGEDDNASESNEDGALEAIRAEIRELTERIESGSEDKAEVAKLREKLARLEGAEDERKRQRRKKPKKKPASKPAEDEGADESSNEGD